MKQFRAFLDKLMQTAENLIKVGSQYEEHDQDYKSQINAQVSSLDLPPVMEIGVDAAYVLCADDSALARAKSTVSSNTTIPPWPSRPPLAASAS